MVIARQSLEQRQHVLTLPNLISHCYLLSLFAKWGEESSIVFPLCSFNYKSNSIMQLKRLISQAM